MQTVDYSMCPVEPWLWVADEITWDHEQLQVANQLFHHPYLKPYISKTENKTKQFNPFAYKISSKKIK